MTEIEECLTCGDTFVQDPHPMNHSFYCGDCGDPREGNESWDDQLAAKIDYQNYLKYGVNGYVYGEFNLQSRK